MKFATKNQNNKRINFLYVLVDNSSTTVATNSMNSSDGQVVRAFASRTADLGLIPSRVKPITLKLVFTAFLLDAQH